MNPIIGFTAVEVGYPYRLRGPGNSQNNEGLIYRPRAIGTQRIPGIELGFFSMQNRAGSTQAAVGLGVRLPNRLWIAGQWVDATTTFTDDTVAAQDDTATDFPLETTTASDGFVVASPVPFNALSIDVGTASVDAVSVARAVRYTNAAGSGWTDFANLFIQDGAATNLPATATTVANEYIIAWAPPTDWGRTQAAGLNGIPGGRYAINVRATDAPTTAAVADAMSVYRLFFMTEVLLDNAVFVEDFGAKSVVMALDPNTPGEGIYGDALVALFNVASMGNRVTALVRGTS